MNERNHDRGSYGNTLTRLATLEQRMTTGEKEIVDHETRIRSVEITLAKWGGVFIAANLVVIVVGNWIMKLLNS